MTDETIKRKVEAFLFIISKGLELHELAEKTGTSEVKVKEIIEELQKEYKERNTAFHISKFNNLYRMSVDRGLINGLNELVPNEFSKSLLKTLSVIAWKPGIKQSKVVKIRGNKSYNHITKLEELGFINTEPFGRTSKLNLSNKFYEYFDIKKGEEKFIFKQFNE